MPVHCNNIIPQAEGHWINITPQAEGHWKICRPRAKHYVAQRAELKGLGRYIDSTKVQCTP